MANRSGKHGDLHMIAIIQPPMPNTADPGYRGTYMNRFEKLTAAKAFGAHTVIPLCIDHAGGDTPDFCVPANKVIGYVTGLGVDHEDNLICTCFIDGTRPELGQIVIDQLEGPRKWGVSAFTKFEFENERRDTVKIGSKEITHLGVTLNPNLGEEGSYIYDYGYNPDKIYAIVRDREIQERALLASATSLERWGVADNVRQHVQSVLEKNISLPDARLTAAALPPAPVYASSETEPQLPAAMSGSAPTAPSDGGADKTKTAASADDDPIVTDSPGAAGATGSDAGAPSMEDVSNTLATELEAALKEAEKFTTSYDKHDFLEKVEKSFKAELRRAGVHLEDLSPDVDKLRQNVTNNIIAIRERWSSDAKMLGEVKNDFNKDMVQKLRDNGTLPDDRRQLAMFVEAANSIRDTTQKSTELKLLKLQEENKQRLSAQKRKYEEEVAALKADYERVQRRATEAGQFTGRSAAPAGSTAARYSPSLFKRSPQSSEQETPTEPVSDPMFKRSAATQNNSNSRRNTGPQKNEDEMDYDYLNSPGHTTLIPGSQAASNSAEKALHIDTTGFVSATGMQSSTEISYVDPVPEGRRFLDKIILPSNKTSYRRGVESTKMKGPDATVFALHFRALSETMATDYSSASSMVWNSDQAADGISQPGYMIQGMQPAEFKLRQAEASRAFYTSY